MTSFPLAFTFVIAMLTTGLGCGSSKSGTMAVENWLHPKSGICELHHTAMRTTVVPDCSADEYNLAPDYGDARYNLFPRAGIDYGPTMYGTKKGLIYVCPQCKAARRAWVRKHGYGGFAPLSEILGEGQ